MVVVPPWAAARVPVSKVSDACVPPNGISMWVWASIPPGMTYLPVASMTRSTDAARSVPSSRLPGARTATMRSPSTRTSAAPRPVALTTVPPLIRVVLMHSSFAGCGRRSRPGDGGVGVGAAVPVELPVVAHLAHHVHVEVADDEL